MAEDNNQGQIKAAGDVSWIQDVLVTAIVALIGTAVALGVYLKAGFGLVPALSVGGGLFIWLLSAHFLITRMRLKKLIDYRLSQLDIDVGKLKKEAEITDLLAEGHNELLTGQNALEKAIKLIAERVDGYDQRLKAVYKLAKRAQDLPDRPASEQAQQFKDMQAELLVLGKQLKTLETDNGHSHKAQFDLIRAELEVLEMVVRQMSIDGDEHRTRFCQKVLGVIEGMRQLPHYREALGQGLQDESRVGAQLTMGLAVGGKPGDASQGGADERLVGLSVGEHGGVSHSGNQQSTSDATNGDDQGRFKLSGKGHEMAQGGPKNEPQPEGKSETLLAVINEAIEANRIELFMQPVVSLPERDLVYYEALSRLRNDLGQLLVPEDYADIADKAGLTSIIDNQSILMAIRVVQKLIARGKAKHLFCHLAFASLRDADFFAEFMDFMEANQWLNEHLVFVIDQPSFDEAGAYDVERLQEIAKLGFCFSLDQVHRLDIDFKNLSEMNFRYIKIKAELLLGNVASAKAEIHPADLAPYLERLNIVLIVSDIARESLVRQLKDYKVQHAQGALFCEPKPVRADVLDEQIESAA